MGTLKTVGHEAMLENIDLIHRFQGSQHRCRTLRALEKIYFWKIWPETSGSVTNQEPRRHICLLIYMYIYTYLIIDDIDIDIIYNYIYVSYIYATRYSYDLKCDTHPRQNLSELDCFVIATC